MGKILGLRFSDKKLVLDFCFKSGVFFSRVIFDVKSEGIISRCKEESMFEVSRRCFSRSKGC